MVYEERSSAAGRVSLRLLDSIPREGSVETTQGTLPFYPFPLCVLPNGRQ